MGEQLWLMLLTGSQQLKPNLPWFQLLVEPPVVQVVAQAAIPNPKFEVLQEARVLKNVQSIEHVVAPEHAAHACCRAPWWQGFPVRLCTLRHVKQRGA